MKLPKLIEKNYRLLNIKSLLYRIRRFFRIHKSHNAMDAIEKREYIMRGVTLSMSSEIEMLVISLMSICHYEDEDAGYLKIIGKPLKDKILLASDLLHDKFPAVFDIVNPIFQEYLDICNFRNQMAHCVFQKRDATEDSFSIWEIIRDKDGIHRLEKIFYTTKQAEGEMIKLSQLVDRIRENQKRINEVIPAHLRIKSAD